MTRPGPIASVMTRGPSRVFWALLTFTAALFVMAAPARAQGAQDEPAQDELIQEASIHEGSAEDEEAHVHFRLAVMYYESGRFVEAGREFQEAYDLSRRPALLYNIFLSWRDASDLGPAIVALRAYLELGSPAPAMRVRLQSQLDGMERRHEAQGRGEVPAHASDDADEAEPVTQPAEERDAESGGGVGVLPIVLMASGGALVLGGVITGVMALGAQNELEEMCGVDGGCPPGYEDTRDRGQTLATVTDVLLIGGLVTAGLGVVLLALGVGSTDEEQPSVSFACTLDGCAGSARVSF